MNTKYLPNCPSTRICNRNAVKLQAERDWEIEQDKKDYLATVDEMFDRTFCAKREQHRQYCSI